MRQLAKWHDDRARLSIGMTQLFFGIDDCLRVAEGFVRRKFRELFCVGRWEIGVAVLSLMGEELAV